MLYVETETAANKKLVYHWSCFAVFNIFLFKINLTIVIITFLNMKILLFIKRTEKFLAQLVFQNLMVKTPIFLCLFLFLRSMSITFLYYICSSFVNFKELLVYFILICSLKKYLGDIYSPSLFNGYNVLTTIVKVLYFSKSKH